MIFEPKSNLLVCFCDKNDIEISLELALLAHIKQLSNLTFVLYVQSTDKNY